jgi:YHS domain-containing protein
MNPLKMLLLVALCYLLYRLFRGSKKMEPLFGDKRLGALKHDILIEDPICHMYVPKSQAVSLERTEKTYYFCSKKCRDAFCDKEENIS